MPIVTKGQVIRLSQPLRGLVRTPWAARAVALDGKRVLRITLTSYAATWSRPCKLRRCVAPNLTGR